MIPFQLAGLATVAAFIAGAGTAWTLTSTFYKAEKAAVAERLLSERVAAEKRADEISMRFEEKLVKLRVVNRTINNEVQREVQIHKQYECDLPASGVRLLNNARGVEANDTGKSDGAVSSIGIRLSEDARRAFTSGRTGQPPVQGVRGETQGTGGGGQ